MKYRKAADKEKINYLSGAARLDRKIDIDLERLTALREYAKSVRSSPLGEKVASSGTGEARFTDIVGKIYELEQLIDEETDKLVDLKSEISEAINSLEDYEEQSVLYFRYVCNLSFARIAENMLVSKSKAFTLHESAISHIKIPKKNNKNDKNDTNGT